ncbi:MAG: hypothetical protein NZ992_00710 [Candidatus Korarchaeum sp.]|nr:hypothetical protein [Candidatus Korarchaeum sp.]MDW8035517.1 hypothetical protein [Candidatus Korarchaeum sp.]
MSFRNNGTSAVTPLINFVRSGRTLAFTMHTSTTAAGSTNEYTLAQAVGVMTGSAPRFMGPLPIIPVLVQNDQIIITTTAGNVSITVSAEIIGRKWVSV